MTKNKSQRGGPINCSKTFARLFCFLNVSNQLNNQTFSLFWKDTRSKALQNLYKSNPCLLVLMSNLQNSAVTHLIGHSNYVRQTFFVWDVSQVRWMTNYWIFFKKMRRQRLYETVWQNFYCKTKKSSKYFQYGGK